MNDRMWVMDTNLDMTFHAASIKPQGRFTREYVSRALYDAALARIAELEAK